MIKSSYLFLAFATGGLGVACVSATKPEAGQPESEPKVQRTQSVNLTKLYNENCANCHGQDGSGGGAGTQTLNTEDLFDQKHDRRFFDSIKNGVPDTGMSAYGETMSEEEIWGLVVKVRELQARALRAKNGSPVPVQGVYKSKRQDFRVETVITEGLSTPWGIDWLPDGRMLITNRNGVLKLYDANHKLIGDIEGIPKSVEMGQGGLMEVTVHPEYDKNGWIYLAYTEPAKEGRGGLTKIVRGKLISRSQPPTWSNQETIYEAKPEFYTGAGVHFGSRIVFDKAGYLFFAIGERGSNMGAQSLATPFGKIMRLNADGSVPKDNPFVGTADADPAVWTYGHRNQQGLVFDLEGKLWTTEHGPRGGDELNLVTKGSNYGWPVVAWSINYNDAPFRTPWPKDDMKVVQPVFRWLPSIGASGLDVTRGAAFPNWNGDLLAGGLAGQNLDRIRVKDGKLVEREELLHNLGRIREVAVHKNGTIYVALNSPNHIIRLVPAK